jgi:hypothetical protein
MIDERADIHVPLLAAVHSHCLARLCHHEWPGCELYYRLKDVCRAKRELFFKVIHHGVLFHIAALAHEHFCDWRRLDVMQTSELYCFAVDTMNALEHHEILPTNNWIDELREIPGGDWEDDQHEDDPALGENDLSRRLVCRRAARLMLPGILQLKDAYSTLVAERLFHDRQLCGYIVDLIHHVGFDGGLGSDDEAPKQWVKRVPIPAWARDAVIARDRMICAQCNTPVVGELQSKGEIDHIRPLRLGGTNDLCNLQFLCGFCNAKKGSQQLEVANSVPQYLKRRRRCN